jgi:hypothetical protein
MDVFTKWIAQQLEHDARQSKKYRRHGEGSL